MGKENGNKYEHRSSAIIIKSRTIPEKFTDPTICRKLQISNIIHDLLSPHLSIFEIRTHYSYFSGYSEYRSHPQPCYKGTKHLSTTVSYPQTCLHRFRQRFPPPMYTNKYVYYVQFYPSIPPSSPSLLYRCTSPPHHDVRKSGSKDSYILNSCTSCRNQVSFQLQPS